MDIFGRLSDYDVFAYLPQGFMALAACDFLFGTQFVIAGDWDVPTGALVVFLSYVAGHVAATPSSVLMERVLAWWLIGRPSRYLLPSAKPRWICRVLFPEYTSPLPSGIQKSVHEKMSPKSIGGSASGEDYFWEAYPLAKRDEHAKLRMERFHNLYSFCRNVSFILGSTACIAWFQYFTADYVLPKEKIVLIWAVSVGSVVMFQRYLKFMRLFSVEVFVTYSKL